MHALTYAVEQAESIRDALGSAVGNYEIAMEEATNAYKMRRAIEEIYDGAEAEFSTLAYIDGRIDGKTAEIRKAQHDALLVQERTTGELSDLWKDRNAAINAHENAKLALDQCSARFSATKHAADLTAAILKAMAL